MAGSYLIEMEPIGDQRGHFVRSFCAREFAECGLDPHLAKASLSFNQGKGTLRGLHLQAEPMAENKLVRCAQGAIFDVIVDIRRDSETFGRWFGSELSVVNNLQLFVPKGFAHGFQTLEENTTVAYHISEFYDPDKSQVSAGSTLKSAWCGRSILSTFLYGTRRYRR